MSWSLVTLGEICSFVNGDRGKNYPSNSAFVSEGIPFINAGNLKDNRIVKSGLNYISRDTYSSLNSGKILKDDLLFCLRGSLGKMAIVDDESEGAIASSLVIIRAGNKIFTKYLFEYLRSSLCKNEILKFSNGVAQPNLSASDLKKFQIPLPPLHEQRRIAAILDQADTLRPKRREALAQLDSLTQSIFIEMFGDPVTNPKGWPDATTLGDVAKIVSGVTKGRNLTGKAVRTVPYLAVANVQDKSLNLSAAKEIDATEEEIQRYLLKKDDLLLTEGGDPDKLGRGTLWNDELPECIHQNHVFRVRLTTDKLTPLFLNWLVGSQRGKKYFLRSAKQTTGIASINMTQLRGFPLLLPPMGLQQEFVRIAGVVDQQQIFQRTALADLDSLFASLQHRAFRGEL